MKKTQNVSLSNSELSIWLDSYNDIFSDFDSRAYNERTLSDDFINEVRKIAREMASDKIELKLLVPSSQRTIEAEAVIVKNMHSHFRHSFNLLDREKKREFKQGVFMTLSGFVFMIISLYFSSLSDRSFFHNAIRVIMEPAGWFMVWTGLDHLYNNSRRKNPDHTFYAQMAHATISFAEV